MFLRKSKLSNQKGQALIIVVLVMVIALTVGLSVATRTIVNLRNTTEQAGSQKALSAAEAGVELAIKNNLAVNDTISSNFTSSGGTATYTTTAVSAGGGSGRFLLNGGDNVPKQDAIYVWVKPYADNFTTTWSGTLTLYWGEGTTSCSANATNPSTALEVAVIYGNPSCTPNFKDCPMLRRYAYDPCNRGNNFSVLSGSELTAANNFTTPTGDIRLNYHKDIDLTTYQVLLIRINPIYNASHIGVSGSPDLAPQGKVITSTGISDSTVTRKLSVFEGYPEVPAAFFPFTLFQPNN